MLETIPFPSYVFVSILSQKKPDVSILSRPVTNITLKDTVNPGKK